jgi:hypothetical protein
MHVVTFASQVEDYVEVTRNNPRASLDVEVTFRSSGSRCCSTSVILIRRRHRFLPMVYSIVPIFSNS